MIYVAWAVFLLSFFAAGVGSQALVTLNLSDRFDEQLQARYIALGGIQVTALAIAHDHTPTVDVLSDSWVDNPGVFQDHPLMGGSFHVMSGRTAIGEPRYGVEDEERRINLNTTPAIVLERLLETTGGLPPREASDTAAAIEDWRDQDTDERQGGAERFYYQSLSDAYDCQDGPFENIEELLLVKGITPEVYRRLAPWVTVYGSGRINLNTAGPAVLRALGLSETGVAGVELFRAGEDNAEGTSDDRQFIAVGSLASDLKTYVLAEDLAHLTQLATDVLTVRSTAFRVALDAEYHHPSSVAHVLCVMDRQGTVQLWTER